MTEAFQQDVSLSPERVAWDVDFALRHVARNLSSEARLAWAGKQVVLAQLDSGEQLRSKFLGNKGIEYEGRRIPFSFVFSVTSPVHGDLTFIKLFQQAHVPYQGLQLLSVEDVTVQEVVEFSPAPLAELDHVVHELHYEYIAQNVGAEALRFAEKMRADGTQFPGMELFENR